MSSPEVQRRLRQQGADVDSLYEISARIEGKVDALDTRVGALDTKVDALDTRVGARDAKVGALDTKLDGFMQNTTTHFEAQTARFDTLQRSNEQTQALLTQVLERLDRG